MEDVRYHFRKVTRDAHAGQDFNEQALVNPVVCFGLVQADQVSIELEARRQVDDFSGQSGVFCNVPAQHKAFLVLVQFGYSPGRQATVNQISEHLAVSVHRRDQSVVRDQGGVTLLKEKAQVGIFETVQVSTVSSDPIHKVHEHLPEGQGASTSDFFRRVSIQDESSFQNRYGMPSGPGAELGILCLKLCTSSSKKGPDVKASGLGMAA
jgi:hypothetical protein